MDFESCSMASLLSSAAESAEDRMVDMELEAAEALADLAHLAMIENCGGAPETATNWGCKGKRVRKRVKSESGFDLNTVDPEPQCSDPVNERAILDQQQDQTICTNILIKPGKAKQDAESLKPSSLCTTRYISMAGGRSRQNLTEAEKEERRIRRILANRESARQTIRRRQALCEELTRKAADLSQENESLKREKRELAVKEYESLETINKHLKAQIAKVIKVEDGENREEVKSSHAEMSSSHTNCPLLLYNHHAFSPLGWPSIIQSSQPVQSRHGLQNAVTFPPNIPTPITGKFASSQEQENPANSNAAIAPLYLVPCPWFFPLHNNGNGFQAPTSSSLKVLQDEIYSCNADGGGSPSKTNKNMENHHLLMPIKVKNEASGLTEAQSTNLNDIPVAETTQDRGSQKIQCCTREATLASAPLCSVGGTFTVKHDSVLQSDYTCHTEAVSKKTSHLASPLPEMKREPVNYPSKKLVDAAAAAEARKRRKELTKLKNLHGRQWQMQC